ncbi:MAG: tRNA pseudouridine(55) synthase TruB [Bacteroidales bacterium]
MSSEKISAFEEGQILLFDKPLYWTSFDLVNKVRIMINSLPGIMKVKVGHAGTLDPLATGLMILCTGKFTKRADEFKDLDKEYIATICLGATTPSHDLETEIDSSWPVDHITGDLLKNTLSNFLGQQQQLPPAHSAKMIGGKRSYEYARKGISKDLAPVSIIIKDIELLSFSPPEATIRILCSKGTYIRALVRDLGEALKSGAYLSALQRTAIGSFQVKNAFSLEKFENFINELKQI